MPLKLYDKEKILNACLSVFARYGYVNTSTSMLAEAAGVSKSLLFHHFKSKKDLYFSVLSECLKQGRLEIDFERLFQEDFFQALAEMGSVRFGYYKNIPNSYIVLREALYETPDELIKDIESKYGMLPVNATKGWERLFEKVPLREGVNRSQAFKLIMMISDHFENRYLSELSGNKNLDENRLRDLVEDRHSFLEIVRYGIEKVHPETSP